MPDYTLIDPSMKLPDYDKNLFTTSINFADYDDNQGQDKDIERFKNELSKILNIPIEQIDVIFKNNKLIARFKDDEVKEDNPLKKLDVLHFGEKVQDILKNKKTEKKEKFKEIAINFDDEADARRFTMYGIMSKSSTLINFGETGKDIIIQDYNNAQAREQDIKLFKEDVARLMGDAIEDIEVRVIENEIFASVIDKKQRARIKFEDPADKERILKIAKQSKSVRLVHFGEKKSETTLSTNVSSGYPDPKSKTKFNQSIDYETFLGENGIHKIKVGVTGDGGLVGDYGIENVKRITIGYYNADYGNLEIKYDPSKNSFGVNGKSQLVDRELEKFKDRLLKKDPTAIAITAGVVALVAGGVAIAANTLKEEKDIKLPIEAKIYDNGKFSVKGKVDTKITLGDHHFKVGVTGGTIETKENIGSGVSSTQKVKYDNDDKKLESELKVEYKGLNAGINNNCNFKDETQTRTHVGVGYNHPIFKSMDGSINYQQDFNHEWKSENHSVGLGLTIRPTENINVGLGLSVGMPTIHDKPNYGASVGVSIKF